MTDDTLPKSKAELMSRIEYEWSALMDVVKQLSPLIQAQLSVTKLLLLRFSPS